jgi:hypothetical protein
VFNGRAQWEAAEIQGWSRAFSVSAVTVLKISVKCDEAHSEEDIMKKIILATALTTGFLPLSRTNGGDAKKGQLDGAWQLISGQPLPKKARDIKIISGHFFFVAYDTETGKPHSVHSSYFFLLTSYFRYCSAVSQCFHPLPM